MTKHEEHISMANIDEDKPFSENEDAGDDEIDAFDEGCDAASYTDGFDPMQALGQLFVTQEGETIPDILAGIRQSLDTLTKVLHKISKNQETQKA